MNKITVIGDAFVDVWMTAHADRRSAEADLPIYDIQTIRRQAGGAHHVANAIQELAPNYVTVIPEFDIDNLPVKSRIVVNGEQVCRFDANDKCQLAHVYSDTIKNNVVVIVDYGKGSINNAIVKKILAAEPSEIWINSKFPQSNFACMDMEGEDPKRVPPYGHVRWVCNQEEYEKAYIFYGQQTSVYVTQGENGIKHVMFGLHPSYNISTMSLKALSSQPVSVCGAGDVVLAALVTTPIGYNELLWAMCAAAEAVETPFTGAIHVERVEERYLAECQKL